MLYSRELCSVKALYVITVFTFIHTNNALYPAVIDNLHDFLTRAKSNKMLLRTGDLSFITVFLWI